MCTGKIVFGKILPNLGRYKCSSEHGNMGRFLIHGVKSSSPGSSSGAPQAQPGTSQVHLTTHPATYLYINFKKYLKYVNINGFKKNKKYYNHIYIYFTIMYSFSKIFYNKSNERMYFTANTVTFVLCIHGHHYI